MRRPKWARRRSVTSFSSAGTSLVRSSDAFIVLLRSLAELARDEGAAQRQLGSGERERFASQLLRHTVDLVEHLARLDLSHVVLRVALAVTHPGFGRLLRNRLVREDADEDAATALDVARDGTTGSFDLAGRDAAALGGLQAELAERDGGATGGDAGVAALLFLAELATCGLQHVLFSFAFGSGRGRSLAHDALDGRLVARRGAGVGARGAVTRATVAARGATTTAVIATRTTRATTIVFAFGLRDHGRFAVGEAVTAVDPDLAADDAVRRLGFGEAIVDVGLQRVEGHATFAVPLAAGDFDAVQATRRHDLDALRAETHRVLHRALHRTAEHDALLELLGDRVGDQLGVDLGLAHFLDVDGHGHVQQLGQRGLQVLDVLALLADHDARTCRVDRDAGVLGGALDQDARDRGILELGLQEFANLQVFGQHLAEIAVRRVPARRPRPGHGQAEAGRVDFLSHSLPLRASVADGHVDVARTLADAVATALRTSRETLQGGALFHVDRGDLEFVDVGAVVVLGVRDRGLESLLDDAGGLLLRELERVQRQTDLLAADQVGDQAALVGRQSHATDDCFGFHRLLLSAWPSCRPGDP